MRTALSTLEVVRPRDLKAALKAMRVADGAERPVPLAGGTDLYVALNAGAHEGRRFVDLWGLRELSGIRVSRDGVRLGALTTFSAIREHAIVSKRYPSLIAAAAEVGARQIQNRATIAGNIANGSPAGDSLPSLLALDAVVHVRSLDGERAIPFDTFYTGYRASSMQPDELIAAVSLPTPARGTVQFFRKVGTRRAQSISKVVMAGALRVERGRLVGVRIGLGSVAPTPIRAREAERVLEGAKLTREITAAARAVLMQDIAPIDDIRSDREYRLAVSGHLLELFLKSAVRR